MALGYFLMTVPSKSDSTILDNFNIPLVRLLLTLAKTKMKITNNNCFHNVDCLKVRVVLGVDYSRYHCFSATFILDINHFWLEFSASLKRLTAAYPNLVQGGKLNVGELLIPQNLFFPVPMAVLSFYAAQDYCRAVLPALLLRSLASFQVAQRV